MLCWFERREFICMPFVFIRTPVCPIRSKKWLKKAAEQGNTDAQRELYKMYEEEGEGEEGIFLAAFI